MQRTQSSYQNSLKALQGQWKEASEVIGEELMPSVSKLIDVLVALIPLIKFLSSRVVEITAAFVAYKTGLVLTYAAIKIYTLATGKAIVMSKAFAATLKAAVVRSGIGVLIIAIGEISYRLGLFGTAVEKMDEIKFEMPEFKLPDVGDLEQFIALNEHMSRATYESKRKELLVEALVLGTRKGVMEANKNILNLQEHTLKGQKQYTSEYAQVARDLATSNEKSNKLEFEGNLNKQERNDLELAWQRIENEREKYTKGLLPAMEHENAILQAKIDFSGQQLELELLKLELDLRNIPHAEVNLELLELEIRKRAALTQQIKDQTAEEKKADALVKKHQKTKRGCLPAIDTNTTGVSPLLYLLAKTELRYCICLH